MSCTIAPALPAEQIHDRSPVSHTYPWHLPRWIRTAALRWLSEVHDQSWCPAGIRDGIREVLGSIPLDDPLVVDALAGLLERNRHSQIVDCCAGTGGVWRQLLPAVRCQHADVKVTLTDLFPPDESQVPDLPGLHVDPSPRDALTLSAAVPGVRTWLRCFHHLSPAQRQQALASAVTARQPVLVVESTLPTWWNLLLNLVLLLVVPLRAVKQVRRHPWRMLFSTLLPVIPLLMTWDALVSVFKTDCVASLHDLVTRLDAVGYRWRVCTGRCAPTTGHMLLLIGEPQ